MDAEPASRPEIDREGLLALVHDLAAAWNAPGATKRTKQRLTHILIQEVVIDLDDHAHEATVAVRWTGGRHTEIRVARTRTGRYPDDRHPSPVEVIRKPWQVPVDALESEVVKIGVQHVIARRPAKLLAFYENKTLKLPGF
jgi:hypothetical protein